jgi:hypothetical protein
MPLIYLRVVHKGLNDSHGSYKWSEIRQSVLHVDDVSGFDVIVGPNTGHSHRVNIFANAILIFENKRIVYFLNFRKV